MQVDRVVYTFCPQLMLAATATCGRTCKTSSPFNKVGYPDIFLTMTCHPQWPEIKNALLPGQSVIDRPDIAARVFRIKPRALMAFVIDEKVFGEVKAHVRVIEFQKRGLPHAHCIFFMTPASKVNLLNPTFVDTIISAEILDEQHRLLRQIVLKHNMHNPCGHLNPFAVCMIDNICSKRFPKDFVDETGHDEAQLYVMYRRRSPDSGGETALWIYRTPEGSSVTGTIDNSWVVPYSPKLSVMFQCHLNVELCVSRIGGIKYLFKYVCKGSDRVTIEMVRGEQRYDEIGHFQDARYVSASEALWRLFQFEIIDKQPTVVRLDVHLENYHTVYFREERQQQAANRPRPGTKITEWFAANRRWPGAFHIKYAEFPCYFTWNKSPKCWKPRAKFRVKH